MDWKTRCTATLYKFIFSVALQKITKNSLPGYIQVLLMKAPTVHFKPAAAAHDVEEPAPLTALEETLIGETTLSTSASCATSV